MSDFIPKIENYLDGEIVENALVESEFLPILKKRLLEKSQEVFKKFLDDAFININFDSETDTALVSCTLFADAGDVEFTKAEPLKDLLAFNGTFFDELSDKAMDNPDVAHEMGEYFKQLAEKCFEIENESRENS